MGNQSEMIEQSEDTRSQLSEKLEVLENEVADTVQNTTEAVAETVENVKETVENVASSVQEAVYSVGAAFDLEAQAKQHPWLVFGGALALGCLTIQFLGGQSRKSRKKRARQPLSASRAATAPTQPAEKSWLWDQVGRFGGLALSSVMSAVRDKITQAVPESLRERVSEEMDHLTTKLGAEPIHDPVGNSK